MHKSIILVAATAAVAACGQSSENAPAENRVANSAAKAPKPAYCFFQDAEMKGWAAKTDKHGNVVVSGKAYREDSRYKAILSPATVSGNKAEVAPTIVQNDTGFGARDDWWSMTETIPDSRAVDTVIVKCGTETLATLKVQRKK